MTDVASAASPTDTAATAADSARTGLRRWGQLLLVAGTAGLVFAGLDRLAGRLVPPHRLSEAVDGVAALASSDPTTLVLGSSHARTFEVVGREVAQRTAGRERIVAVPIEYGKMTSYRWLLEHRLLPLIDERHGTERQRPSLRRFVLVTEWWDSCDPIDGQFPPNVPARAWGLADFIDDVRQHGLTDYNRSYIAEQWRSLTRSSALLQDRGYGRLWESVRERYRPTPASDIQAKLEADIGGWQRMIEEGTSCLGAATQMAAYAAILDSLRARHVAATVLLYPRKPATLTDKAKATTLALWSRMAEDSARAHGASFIDLTYTTPLTDEQFARDFDHVTAGGNVAFSRWALDGPLAFLLGPPTPGAQP